MLIVMWVDAKSMAKILTSSLAIQPALRAGGPRTFQYLLIQFDTQLGGQSMTNQAGLVIAAPPLSPPVQGNREYCLGKRGWSALFNLAGEQLAQQSSDLGLVPVLELVDQGDEGLLIVRDHPQLLPGGRQL